MQNAGRRSFRLIRRVSKDVKTPDAASLHQSRTRRIENKRWTLGTEATVTEYLDLFKDLAKSRSESKPKTKISLESNDGPISKMRTHIQFLTVPTVDTPGTGLILHFDDKRYFFGHMHEGFQRATLHHGSKHLKVREMFLTGRTEVQTTGGLMGMILTLADSAQARVSSMKEAAREKRERFIRRAEEEEARRLQKATKGSQKTPMPVKVPPLADVEIEPVMIHGGPNIMHTLAAARSFVFRQGLPIDVDEFFEGTERTGPELDWKPTWEDENVRVWAMPIVSAAKAENDTVDQMDVSDGQTISKKRSHRDYIKGQQEASKSFQGVPTNFGSGEEEQAQQLREHIVHEMFRSEWRSDSLVQKKLADVKLPAKIWVRDTKTKALSLYNGPLPGGDEPVPDVDVLVRQAWPGSLVPILPATKHSATAMSYVIQGRDQRGKFNIQKARELKIPVGSLYARLTEGKSVTLPDKRIITPDQVLEPGKAGGGVAIVDLPTRDFVESLISREEWNQEKIMRGIGAFIWLLGSGVAQDERIIAFMRRFDKLQHIVSSSDLCQNQITMTAAAATSVRHQIIDPDRYSTLLHDNTPPSEYFGSYQSTNCVVARAGMMLQLEPHVEIDPTDVYRSFDFTKTSIDVSRDIYGRAQRAKKIIIQETPQLRFENSKLPSSDAEILCLGTGSAVPSLYRNVSATLLRVPGHGSYLFDVGENTLGQLKRMHSPSELADVLQDLKMIWISHLHADHHLGTASLIKAWYNEVYGGKNTPQPSSPSPTDTPDSVSEILGATRRLFVASSYQMMRWLYEYSSVEDYGYSHIVPLEVNASTSNPGETRLKWNTVDLGFQTSHPTIASAISTATGLSNLSACFVEHCYQAMAVAITFPTGFKFAYSGDCRPSRTFSLIGKGATVLVHEATFDDELEGDAQAKKHSTISEAVGVGMKMGAKRLLLTHFSQRYQRIPSMRYLEGRTVQLESPDLAGTGDGDVEGQMEPLEDLDTVVEADAAPAEQDLARKNRRSTTPVRIQARKDMKIAVAFDYMRVKVGDIALLEYFTPALRTLYREG